MASNREIKAQAEARRREYQAKLAEVEIKAKRRKNDNRFAVVLSIVAVALAAGATLGHQAATPTASPTPSASPTTSGSVPPTSVSENRTWTGSISLNGKPLAISLDGKAAPQAVASFVSLAKKGFFNNTRCHRLTTSNIYVLQCGDPTATGTGGPGYSFGPIENAPSDDVYKTGVLAMARQSLNGNSMGSQFFIVYKDSQIQSDTAGGYTVFGKVTDGLSAVNAIAAKGVAGGGQDGKPLAPAVITAVTVK